MSIQQSIKLQMGIGHVHERLNISPNIESTSLYSTETADNWDSVPVVKAFAHIPKNSLSNNPIVAVYWDDKSRYNRFKEHAEKSKTKAEIEAVCLSLKQAIFQMNLPRVRIITNSKFVWKHFGKTSLWWNVDEFLQQKSMPFSFCSAEAEDLYQLLHMIDVTLEYDPSTDEIAKMICKNSAIEKPNKKESSMISKGKLSPESSSLKISLPKEKKNGLFVRETSSKITSCVFENGSIPIVYTCGVLHTEGDEKKYFKAGYGVFWPHALSLGTGKRYNFYPITLIRCQLQAIIDALQQAVDQNYRCIVLRTDCVSFLVHHSRQWLKANGSYVRYHDQYLRILDLCKNIKVKFQLANDQAALRQAEALAENGICLPLPSKRHRQTRVPYYSSRNQAGRKEVMELKSASKRSNQMKKNEGNIKRQSKSYPVGTLLTDAITQHSENSVSDCEKVERVVSNIWYLVISKFSSFAKGLHMNFDLKGTLHRIITPHEIRTLKRPMNQSLFGVKHLVNIQTLYLIPTCCSTIFSNGFDFNCQIISSIKTASTAESRDDEVTCEVSRAADATDTQKAFEWISKNVKSIYKDPVKSCGRLRVAVGNRSIPVDIAVKSLRMFVQNHTILEVDMMKHCFFEGRSEITMNELSEMLKRLMKMKIKHILFNNSDLSSAVLVRNSSDVSEVRNHYFQQKH
uniref:RNase H type-1 domain-containing protein n=1 Tax=Setaria digitata TaxID=48799 RepID=A0A915PN49_9BILA